MYRFLDHTGYQVDSVALRDRFPEVRWTSLADWARQALPPLTHDPERKAPSMTADPPDYFQPETGAVLTHLLIVRDVDRSREFYERVLEATVIRERGPCVLRFHNSYIVLNTEGGPTDDKPDVQARAPADSGTLSSAMNIRVSDVRAVYERWRARGGEFLTEPKDHELEIRCYLCDPDGYLIEVGQGTGILDEMGRR